MVIMLNSGKNFKVLHAILYFCSYKFYQVDKYLNYEKCKCQKEKI